MKNVKFMKKCVKMTYKWVLSANAIEILKIRPQTAKLGHLGASLIYSLGFWLIEESHSLDDLAKLSCIGTRIQMQLKF